MSGNEKYWFYKLHNLCDKVYIYVYRLSVIEHAKAILYSRAVENGLFVDKSFWIILLLDRIQLRSCLLLIVLTEPENLRNVWNNRQTFVEYSLFEMVPTLPKILLSSTKLEIFRWEEPLPKTTFFLFSHYHMYDNFHLAIFAPLDSISFSYNLALKRSLS